MTDVASSPYVSFSTNPGNPERTTNLTFPQPSATSLTVQDLEAIIKVMQAARDAARAKP